MSEPEITVEEANAAYQQLTGTTDESITLEPTLVETEPSTEVEPEVEPVEATTEEVIEGEDDLTSLQNRNQELEAKQEAYEARLEASQARHQENEKVLRDRLLRKSTVADRALQTLQNAQSSEGVSEEDVKRVIAEIQGTMNPASPSYVQPTAPIMQPSVEQDEDRNLMLNDFLNEKSMTVDEAQEFGRWIQTDAADAMPQSEQAVADASLPGFLQLAHIRWRQGMQETTKDGQRNDAVDAVKSVQRTQRQAAKAASGTPTAPKKQPVGTIGEVDIANLTDEDVSTLLRQSVDDYK